MLRTIFAVASLTRKSAKLTRNLPTVGTVKYSPIQFEGNKMTN